MKLIGIIGAAGSGKDTLAQFLIDKHGFKKLSFAKTVKDVAAIAFDWDRELLEGTTKESREFREKVDEYWGLTPRLALQKIGTEMFRENISRDFWLKRLRKEIEKAGDTPVVISDCRFLNEADFIKELGGTIVYVKRDAVEKPAASGTHASELEFYSIKPDITLNNNGTLEEFLMRASFI